MKIRLELTENHFQEILKKGYSLDLIFLLKLIQQEGWIEGDKVDMLILTAKRKGLLNDNNTLSLEGKSLIDFLSSDISGEVFVKQKPTATDFDIWWKAYPATDTFTHNGKSFEGSRAMKVRKDDCKEKLTKILSEGEYTIGELVEALQMEVMQKKENSVKTGTNKMSFMQNSLTYLNQRTFEPFIELVKEGVKIKPSSIPTKSVDI